MLLRSIVTLRSAATGVQPDIPLSALLCDVVRTSRDACSSAPHQARRSSSSLREAMRREARNQAAGDAEESEDARRNQYHGHSGQACARARRGKTHTSAYSARGSVNNVVTEVHDYPGRLSGAYLKKHPRCDRATWCCRRHRDDERVSWTRRRTLASVAHRSHRRRTIHFYRRRFRSLPAIWMRT